MPAGFLYCLNRLRNPNEILHEGYPAGIILQARIVSHNASAKPELVKRVIELYSELKTPKEIGEIVKLNCCTVRQILKDNGIYIRKAWEYTKK